MTGWEWLAVLAAAGAVGLLVPPRSRVAGPVEVRPRAAPDEVWRRWRPLWCLLAGCAAVVFLGGTAGLVAGPVVAAGSWVALGRAEPGVVRREREAVSRDLPHLVELLAATLRSGAGPAEGLATAAAALPGPAATRLEAVRARLELGVSPVAAWESLEADPVLAPLGRAMARSQASGSSVVLAVARLAEDLERDLRAAVEDRARAVGVKAALPLGLCLLPAFLLLGIVPTVAGLLETLT